MDFCWILQIKFLAIFLIIPTLILTFLIKKREKNLVSIPTIFGCWTLMNIFWMLSEWFIIPLFVPKIFLIFGFTLFLLFIHDEYLLGNGITKKEKY
jgi:hypothetical protein